MEKDTITFLQPELEDFFEFKYSSAGRDLFSDDDSEEEDAYIQIDLESTLKDADVEGEEKDENSEYFPVSSFSWSTNSLPLQEFSSSTSTASTSPTTTRYVCPINSPSCPQTAIELPQLHRNDKQNGHEDHLQLTNNRGNWKLVQSRKASRVVTSGMNNKMMKLLVKFRSNIKHFKSMLASLTTKTEKGDANSEDNNDKKSKAISLWNHERLMIKPFGTEIKMEAVRGMVIEAISSMNIKIGGKGKNKRKSCQNSINSSLNQNKVYARDNSVQAAIAHCKTSFHQAPHFRS